MPERFRGCCPFGATAVDPMLGRSVSARDSPALAVLAGARCCESTTPDQPQLTARARRRCDSSSLAGRGRVLDRGPLGRQLRQRALDVAPDAAEGDAEDALAAAQQVDHLVVGGALEDRDAVAHQGDLGQVLDPAGTQVLDRGPDLLQRDAGVDQPLDHLEDQDVAEAVEPLGAGAGGAADLGHDQSGAGPVVELPVGDPGRAAGDRTAEPEVARQRREVALEQQLLRVLDGELAVTGRAG